MAITLEVGRQLTVRMLRITGAEITRVSKDNSTVTRGNVPRPGATFASSDDTKATVDEYGVVTGVGAGSVTITATDHNESSNNTATLALTIVSLGTTGAGYALVPAIEKPYNPTLKIDNSGQ